MPSKPSVPLVSAHKPSSGKHAVETFMSAQCAMPPCDDVDVKGVKFTIKTTKMAYCTNAASVAKSHGSLIDGGANNGANGGLAGADVRLVSTGSSKADVMGILSLIHI